MQTVRKVEVQAEQGGSSHETAGLRADQRGDLPIRFRLLTQPHPHAARGGRCGNGSLPNAGRGFGLTMDGRQGAFRPEPFELRPLPHPPEPLADGQSGAAPAKSQAGRHPDIAAAIGRPCAGRCSGRQQCVRWTSHPPPAAGCRHAAQFGHVGHAHGAGDAAGFAHGLSEILVQWDAYHPECRITLLKGNGLVATAWSSPTCPQRLPAAGLLRSLRGSPLWPSLWGDADC